MTSVAVEFKPITQEAVRRLAKVKGACLSMYLPSYQQGSSAAKSDVLLRSYTNLAAEQISIREVSDTDIEDLLEPIRRMQTSDERLQKGHSETLAVFRSPGFFEVLTIPGQLAAGMFVEAAFRILPLLEFLAIPSEYWVLALTRKGVRLLHNDKPAKLPASIPATIEEFLALEHLDRRDNRVSAGPSVGRSKGVSFGTSTEAEVHHRHFKDYCVAIDRGLCSMFDHTHPPLVLAGATAEVAVYRRNSRYSGLASEAILRSPDDGSLSDAELGTMAKSVLMRSSSPAEDRANAHVYGALGSPRAITELNALVRAAAKGKVEEIFLCPGLATSGDIDHITGRVPVSGEMLASYDDLYNAAAVETLNHSGEVFVVPLERIPGGFGAVAALRY